jgi:hypothetical protein
MDVFAEYKPLRNRIATLARDEALATIWSYCQYLQIDEFKFPPEIEVSRKFLELDVPQKWISEWVLELLAKEVIINSGARSSKGLELRAWNDLTGIISAIKSLEDSIYEHFGSPENVLVELIRISHRQFIWQANPPNAAAIIRYFRIFNRPVIDQICLDRFGLNVWQIFMSGVAFMGFFLTRPAVTVPLKSEIVALPPSDLEKFLSFSCISIAELRLKLKAEQRYGADYAYAYNSLRAYPLVRMSYQGADAIVCPLMTLLFWKFAGGLYYDLISDQRFPNEFGDGFQAYVGDVVERAFVGESRRRLPDIEYLVGRNMKRSVDWIVFDGKAALFLECKSKRLSWGAKSSLTDLAALQADIDVMADAVVQIYRTLADYEAGLYVHFPYDPDIKVFPTIVTPENWRLFGPVMLAKLDDAVAMKLAAANLPPEVRMEKPYSVWAIEELEAGLQVMNKVAIRDFVEGKLNDSEMRRWDWHAYMTHRWVDHFPVKRLFDKEYDEMFSKLLNAQGNRQSAL